MATSGAYTWNPAATDIVAQSLRHLGVIDEDEEPTAAMYTVGMFQLNAITKAAEATGLHVWTEEEAILFPQPLQAKYVLGAGSGLPAPLPQSQSCDADTWQQLYLSAGAALGATSIQVTIEPVGLMAGDDIGIVLATGPVFWTTLAMTPASATLALSGALPAAVNNGGLVWVYPAVDGPIQRPLKVPKARLLTFSSTYTGQGPNETPMTVMSRQEYMDLPNKRSPGTPTQFFYSPRRDQGFLYIWPVPVIAMWGIRFTWYRSLQDWLSPANTADFPQEWVNPLIFRLAYEQMGIYDSPLPRQALIKAQKEEYWDLAVSWDRESEPVRFGMDWEFEQRT